MLFKARSVAYSMQPLVDKELDKLVKDGVIEPVHFADWAAPIVPVLKSDKTTVRVCGDLLIECPNWIVTQYQKSKTCLLSWQVARNFHS